MEETQENQTPRTGDTDHRENPIREETPTGRRPIGDKEEAGEEDPREDHRETKATTNRPMVEVDSHHKETLTGEVHMGPHLMVEVAEEETRQMTHQMNHQTAMTSQETMTNLRKKEAQKVANAKANHHHADDAMGNMPEKGDHGSQDTLENQT